MKVKLLRKLRKEARDLYRIRKKYIINGLNELKTIYYVEKMTVGESRVYTEYVTVSIFSDLNNAIKCCDEYRNIEFQRLAISKINKNKNNILY